jgi:hypothetical protein
VKFTADKVKGNISDTIYGSAFSAPKNHLQILEDFYAEIKESVLITLNSNQVLQWNYLVIDSELFRVN